MLTSASVALFLASSNFVRADQPPAAAATISVSLSGSVTEAASDLAAKTGTPVLVDPSVSGSVTGTFNNSSVDQVLDAVSSSVKARWVKAFIPESTPKADEIKAAKEQVAALEAVKETKPVMVYDPASKSQIILTKFAPDPARDLEDAKALGLRPVYLIYAPPPPPRPAATATAPSGQNATDYSNLGKQQQAEFLKMTPDQRVKALEQSLADEIATDPTTRSEYMRARMEAMNALRQSNSPVYQQWRDSQRQNWQNMGGNRGNWGNRQRGVGPGGDPNNGNWRGRRGGGQAPAQ